MQVLYHPGDCATTRPCAVTIGAYDGVHVGHRLLIARVRRVAAEQSLASAVVTFDQHPAAVVRPESAPRLLTDLEQKLELLGETGVDYVLVVRFDRARSQESAEDFVREVLVGCLNTRAVVVGHDFHFGYRRRGNVAMLQTMGAELGFDVTGLRLFPAGPGDLPVSSTRIRELLASGAVEEAAALLGRPHQVRGVVTRGDERGS
jgi:riboflavin kinase/FMN adenylyltransferase